ncbi:unnamed protein product [Linum tenue]|uniref:non-specific serine/threonine protein kinase n=2 Tax=Linum TaxID=4005 RepID=A0AAV0PB93_9ROSI|nr:unnamed protein product [Linum tenue]
MVSPYHSSSFRSLLLTLCTLIITISTSSVSSQDDDDQGQRFQDCARLFECGDIQAAYPFWGGGRPSYCGLSDLNLTCNATTQITTITILDLTYQVLRVDDFSRILTLVRADNRADLCPAEPLINTTTIESSLLSLAPDTQLVTLYYGCSPLGNGVQAPASLGRFNCGRDNSSQDYFVTSEGLAGSYDAAVRTLLGSCGARVTVPANRTAVAGLESSPTAERLEAAIGQGFGARWAANDTLCATCRDSGGQCGSVGGSFTCWPPVEFWFAHVVWQFSPPL